MKNIFSIFTILMKPLTQLVTSLKSFALPIIKSNVVKITTSRFTLLFTPTLNKISGWKHISAATNYYKTLNNYHWFQLTKKIMKIFSYINLCIISVIFVWHADYYSLVITVRRMYSESFKFVFQPIWNTIIKLTNNISNDSIINQSKNGFIDSSRIREFYTSMDANLCDSNTESTSTDNINDNYKEQVTTFLKNNQYYIIGGILFIITATGIYYYSNDISTWIAASGLTAGWSKIKEYFTWGSGNNLPDDDSTSVTSRGSVDSVIIGNNIPDESASVGSGTVTPNHPQGVNNSSLTQTWTPPVYNSNNLGLPLPEDNFSEANLLETYPSPNQSPAPNEIPLPSSHPSSSASPIVESSSPTPSIIVTESSPILSPISEIEGSQVPLPESPAVRRSTDTFTDNRIDRSTSVSDNLPAKSSDGIRRSKSS